jgi:hypothetical protein
MAEPVQAVESLKVKVERPIQTALYAGNGGRRCVSAALPLWPIFGSVDRITDSLSTFNFQPSTA